MIHPKRPWALLTVVGLGSIAIVGCDSRLPLAVSPPSQAVALRPSGSGAPLAQAAPGAPVVRIVDPEPGTFFTPLVPTPVTISWEASDPDGRIVEYRYKVIHPRIPEMPGLPDAVGYFYEDPSRLEQVWGPDFKSWEKAKPGTTSATFSLYPQQMYLFAVMAVGQDRQHAGFDLSTNVLRFAVRYATGPGPWITIYERNSPFYSFTNGGSDLNDPSLYNYIFRPRAPLEFYWSAIPQGGAHLVGYRWGLDLEHLDLPIPSGPGTPPRRWSPQSLDNTSVTLGPFEWDEIHHLFVEAEDDRGNKSLLVTRIHTDW